MLFFLSFDTFGRHAGDHSAVQAELGQGQKLGRDQHQGPVVDQVARVKLGCGKMMEYVNISNMYISHNYIYIYIIIDMNTYMLMR